MSDELDPTTPPMPEARPADPTPFAPPSTVPSDHPLPAGSRPVTAGRGGMARTRTIAGVAALAAGVAITAGIAVAARDDSTNTAATTTTDASTGPVGALPSLDAGSATGVPGAQLDGAAIDADGDSRVGLDEGGTQAFDGAPPDGGRGHHGQPGELGAAPDQDADAAGSAMPAPPAGGDASTMPQTGTPDTSSQGS